MESERVSWEDELLRSLELITATLGQFKIRYALIGGIAVGFRSRPRATADLDFLLDIPQLTLPALLAALEKQGFEFDLETLIREWTQHHLVVLQFGKVRIDWLKPVLPAYRHVLDTSSIEPLVNQSVSIASAEGLILTKLIAFRLQDKADIANLLAANRNQLNLDWIRGELMLLVDREDARFTEFEAMIASSKSS
jgi:hypothetical protein